MSLLVAFSAGEIGNRQINEDRWPSCTPFMWARPEDERRGGNPTRVRFVLSADFVIPNPAPSAPASASGRTVQSSRKQGETPCPWKWPSLFQWTTVLGQSLPKSAICATVGLYPIALVQRTSRHFALVPTADLADHK